MSGNEIIYTQVPGIEQGLSKCSLQYLAEDPLCNIITVLEA